MRKFLIMFFATLMLFTLVACSTLSENNRSEISNTDRDTMEKTNTDEPTTVVEASSQEPPHTHTYGDWITVKGPTCTEDGILERICECGEKETDITIAKEHIAELVYGYDPTCTMDGLTNGSKCSVCNSILTDQEVIPANGHRYVEGYCSICNHLKISQGLEYQLGSNKSYYFVDDLGTCTDEIIVIPSTYNDLPVRAIGNGAFYGKTSFKKVILPDSITSIYESAFRNCTNLVEINIPDSVTYIGDLAFSSCTNLTSITLPHNNTEICAQVFYNCSNAIEIENGVFYVDKWAVGFDGVATSVVLREDTVGIVAEAFANFHNITEVTLPYGLLRIGSRAFDFCINLKSINIPNSVITIGDGAFEECYQLSHVILSNSLTDIGHYAFRGCSFTNIVIPDSVTYLGSGVFQGCKKLTRVSLPNRITDINSYLFSGCSSLTDITIPEGVNYIGGAAFYYCISLENIHIPDTVTMIAENSFEGCDFITVENGVKYVENWVVGYQDNITSITLRSGTVGIAAAAFQSCLTLESIVIPNGVIYLGRQAFEGCVSLTSVTLPEGITVIDYWTFDGCIKLEAINIPSSVTEIGVYAFRDCASLENIFISDHVTRIDNHVFQGCSNLTIYCEAEKAPNNWDEFWNVDNLPVKWGQRME